MKLTKFDTFLLSLYDSDPLLIESIMESYNTIFESTSDIAIDVLRAYQLLINPTNLPLRSDEFEFTSFVTMRNKEIQIVFTNGTINKSNVTYPNIVNIKDFDIIVTLLNDDMDDYFYILKTNSYMNIIIHELSHIYEYLRRTPNDVDAQKAKIDLKRYNTDGKYHDNNKIELLPHKISTIAVGIIDAINNGITNEHEIIQHILKNKDVNEMFSNLTNNKKRKVMQSIANTLHNILTTNTELSQVINAITSEFTDNEMDT